MRHPVAGPLLKHKPQCKNVSPTGGDGLILDVDQRPEEGTEEQRQLGTAAP